MLILRNQGGVSLGSSSAEAMARSGRSAVATVALGATAVERADPLYNCLDESLAAYDRNDYPWLPGGVVGDA